MPFLVLAIVVSALGWLFVKRTEDDPAARRAGIAWAIALVGAAVAVRAGLGLLVVGVGLASLVAWLSKRGRGGGGPGDGGPDPPKEPEPDPGADVRPEPLDRDAFDRARAEWEQELPKRG